LQLNLNNLHKSRISSTITADEEDDNAVGDDGANNDNASSCVGDDDDDDTSAVFVDEVFGTGGFLFEEARV
jgi:hypothetical protein